MNNLILNKYNSDNKNDIRILNQLVNFFILNFPTYYSEEQRLNFESKRGELNSLSKTIDDGSVILTMQDINNKIIGLLEYSLKPVEGGTYIMLTWLIVDQFSRGMGISSLLHKEFEKEAEKIKNQIKGNSCKLLSVHENNIAKKIYEKWGYESSGDITDDGMIFMYKD